MSDGPEPAPSTVEQGLRVSPAQPGAGPVSAAQPGAGPVSAVPGVPAAAGPVSGGPVSAAPGGGALMPLPAPERRNLGRVFGAVAAALVVYVTAAVLLAIFVVVPWWWSSERLATASVRALASADTVHYRGSFIDRHGRAATLDLMVDRKGRAAGWTAREERRAEVLVVGRGTYLKADAAYWAAERPGMAGAFAGRWAEAGPLAVGIDVDRFLVPSALARTLQRQLLADGGDSLRNQPAGRVRGESAVKIPTADGGGLYVGADSHRALRVEGSLLTGLQNDHPRSFSLDVSIPGEQERSALSERLRGARGIAERAADASRSATMPAYFDVEEVGEPDDETCTDLSCPFKVTVRNRFGPPAPGAGAATIFGVFTLGRELGGPVIGRCDTAIPAAAWTKKTQLTCVVGDETWANHNRRTPEEYWYMWQVAVFTPGWHGTNPANLKYLLDRGVDEEKVNEISDLGGGMGLDVFARLMRDRRLTGEQAYKIVQTAVAINQLDVVHAYVASGRVGSPRELERVLIEAKVELSYGAIRVDALRQLQLAADRAKNGRGAVSLGRLYKRGGKPVPGQPDVIDAGRKEVVQQTVIAVQNADAVLEEIRKDAEALRGNAEVTVPAGYRTIIELRIEALSSELYRLDPDGVRRELRERGLDAGALAEVNSLVVINRTGRHAFTPADFR